MPFLNDYGLITVAEARTILPVSAEYIRRALARGEMRGAIYGQRWMTTEKWVREYIEERARARMKQNQKKPTEEAEPPVSAADEPPISAADEPPISVTAEA